ncbi:MAG: hypothetical protein ACI8RZ_006938 [Myxococcota bacterium]|jgi:hypothetical protein
MIIAMLAACGRDVTLETEVTVPGDLLSDITYPHRIILALDVPDAISDQVSLGEICVPQGTDLILTHTVSLEGCALPGTITAWLEPASTDATCELSAGDWEPITEPPQGAPVAEAGVFEGVEKCRSGSAETWLTLGVD